MANEGDRNTLEGEYKEEGKREEKTIGRIINQDGKFSRKGYPKQTSFGYRIFYKFYNL